MTVGQFRLVITIDLKTLQTVVEVAVVREAINISNLITFVFILIFDSFDKI